MELITVKTNLAKAKELLGAKSHIALELNKIIESMEGRGEILATDIISAAEILNLSLDTLVSRELSSYELCHSLDLKSPGKDLHYHRYAVNPESFARKKTIITMSKYFDNVLGEGFVNRLHRKLGISRNDLRLDEHNQKISPTLVMDFLMSLLEAKIDPNIFNFMAKTLSSQSVPKAVQEKFRALKARESMELFTQETLKGNFDNLFNYQFIRAKNNELVVQVKAHRENHTLYSKEVIGNKALCKYKVGVFESFLNISGVERVYFVQETSCLYEGGDCCKYHFSVLPCSPGKVLH